MSKSIVKVLESCVHTMQFCKCVTKLHYLSIKPCSRLRKGEWGIDKVVDKNSSIAVLHRFNLFSRVSYCNWNSEAYLPHWQHLNAIAVKASSREELSCAAADNNKTKAEADAEAVNFLNTTSQLKIELKLKQKPTELTVSCTPLTFQQTCSFVSSVELNLAPIWVIISLTLKTEAASETQNRAAA